MTDVSAFTSQQLGDIQGFGIAGFSKDYQESLFIRFPGADQGKALLGLLAPQVASAWEVGTFNEVFSEVRARSKRELLKATWLAAMISAQGYAVLGVSTNDLPDREGTNAFNAGMAARSAQIGDTRPTDIPTSWLPPFQPGAGVHMAIVVASDDPADLGERVEAVGNWISTAECEVVFQESGQTLPPPLTGHEHFGFKDGISQPAIVGYDATPGALEPPPIPPGEFVVGLPDNSGSPVQAGPNWQNGCFVVFRRLRQDVAAFRAQAAAGVPGANPLSAGQLAADMIGRWPSGAPLELNPIADPGYGGVTNAFDYLANDPTGTICPVWAHVRKANPRDEPTPNGAGDNPSEHRMIRRGIPYGPPLSPDAIMDDKSERGLHFFCVVSDLDQQFEFVQLNWLSNPNFPGGSPGPSPLNPYSPPSQGQANGPDPVVGEFEPGTNCVLLQQSNAVPFPLATEVVKVTAGEYFFLPAISVLSLLGTGASSSQA